MMIDTRAKCVAALGQHKKVGVLAAILLLTGAISGWGFSTTILKSAAAVERGCHRRTERPKTAARPAEPRRSDSGRERSARPDHMPTQSSFYDPGSQMTCGRRGCQTVPKGCVAVRHAGGHGLGGKIFCRSDSSRERSARPDHMPTQSSSYDPGSQITCGRRGCQTIPKGCIAVRHAGGHGLGGKIFCQ
jgi:hypothetical protein